MIDIEDSQVIESEIPSRAPWGSDVSDFGKITVAEGVEERLEYQLSPKTLPGA